MLGYLSFRNIGFECIIFEADIDIYLWNYMCVALKYL